MVAQQQHTGSRSGRTLVKEKKKPDQWGTDILVALLGIFYTLETKHTRTHAQTHTYITYFSLVSCWLKLLFLLVPILFKTWSLIWRDDSGGYNGGADGGVHSVAGEGARACLSICTFPKKGSFSHPPQPSFCFLTNSPSHSNPLALSPPFVFCFSFFPCECKKQIVPVDYMF